MYSPHFTVFIEVKRAKPIADLKHHEFHMPGPSIRIVSLWVDVIDRDLHRLSHFIGQFLLQKLPYQFLGAVDVDRRFRVHGSAFMEGWL